MSFQRRKIVRFLERRGCRIIREGGDHTIFGDDTGRTASVPRHRNVKRSTARKIAKGLALDLELFLREVR